MAEKRSILIDSEGKFVGTDENPLYVVAEGVASGASIHIGDVEPEDTEKFPIWLKEDTGELFFWRGEWVLVSGGGGGSGIYIGPVAPEDPEKDPIWFYPDTEKMYYYYVDPVSELPSWREIGKHEFDGTGYLKTPISSVSNMYNVLFYSGEGKTHTNGIKTNIYGQLDMNYAQIKNAVIDCGAFYD